MNATVVPYLAPVNWIAYDRVAIVNELANAKASVLSLTALPHQRDWLDRLQEIQLKMEVAGTSRIEGAEFTEAELDAAVSPVAVVEQLTTRSQKQAHAATETYRWIATLPEDMPISEHLIREIHRRMVIGCDDDHCAPGILRRPDQNVTFGTPKHRGCDGGEPCKRAFSDLVHAVRSEYPKHDPLIQAVALHYHFASMHPFLDGNGRTARALEALLLQRAGLRDTAFIAMSNYYYEEKASYLAVLAEVRAGRHDLTPLIQFCLRGVAKQCFRLFREITRSVKKALFRNMMFDLFRRLESPRKRVIAERQLRVLKVLLDAETDIAVGDIYRKCISEYEKLSQPAVAFGRDISALLHLGAIEGRERPDGKGWMVRANLDWPEQITESDFMRRVRDLPKTKTHAFL